MKMQNIIFKDAILFRHLFTAISRFVNQVHFDVSPNGLKIVSIDPHDFCYIDLFMSPQFFKEFNINKTISFGLEIKKLGKILPKISVANKISLNFNEDSIELIAQHEWKMNFIFKYLVDDIFDLSKPKEIKYNNSITIDAKEFSKLIDTASVLSTETKFLLNKNGFYVKTDHEDFTFLGEPSKIDEIQKSISEVESSVVSNYLRQLSSLFNYCDRIRVNLDENQPIKLDLIFKNAEFTFIFSHKRNLHNKKRMDRQGTSLPRLSVSKFPEFLIYISAFPNGQRVNLLINAGFETKGRDYSRLARNLELVEVKEGRIFLSDKGKIFINYLRSNSNDAKRLLHGLVYEKYDSYRNMVGILKNSRYDLNELFNAINRNLQQENKPTIDFQDISTLLGIGLWCGLIDKKMALIFLNPGYDVS